MFKFYSKFMNIFYLVLQSLYLTYARRSMKFKSFIQTEDYITHEEHQVATEVCVFFKSGHYRVAQPYFPNSFQWHQ